MPAGDIVRMGSGHDGGMDSGIPWRTKSTVALSAMPWMVPKTGSLLGSRGEQLGTSRVGTGCTEISECCMKAGRGGGGLFEKFMEIVIIIHLPSGLGLTRVTSP